MTMTPVVVNDITYNNNDTLVANNDTHNDNDIHSG